tara:strand:+ start:379 stop:573 length:195 start_codon:yes stop_codon:yes gene_type:complete
MSKHKKLANVLPRGKKNKKKRKRQRDELCHMLSKLFNQEKKPVLVDDLTKALKDNVLDEGGRGV